MIDEIKKRPKVCVGALIVNKDGKILLTRAPKWHNKLTWPGGHVEWGETMGQALKREIKEEVGLDIYDPQLIAAFEFIESDDYVKDRHIISLDYFVKTNNLPDDVKIDGVEITEYYWLTPEEAIRNPEVEATTKDDVKIYLEKFYKGSTFVKAAAGEGKHGLFSRACKGCEDAKVEAQEYKSGWQRALADYKNLQREVEQRRGEWAEMSEAQILEEFIPVYDNFKKAFGQDFTNGQGSADGTNENWKKGIEYIKKQFAEVLKKHGIEDIKTVGEKFDPNLHEAAGEESTEDRESGEIIKEVAGGYKMGERVVRAARVIVSK